jgi:hypothetical protein
MAAKPEPVNITSGSQLLGLVDSVTDEPVSFERNGVRYKIIRVDAADIAYEPDPDYVLKVLRETAGTWSDLDIDQMISDVYEARRVGSRPDDRP